MRSAWRVANFTLGAAAATAMAALAAACSADNTTVASASSPTGDTDGIILASAPGSGSVGSAPPTELDARTSLKNTGAFWRVDFGTLKSKAEAETALHSVRALGFNHAQLIAESRRPAELVWNPAAPSATTMDASHAGRQKASVEKAHVTPGAIKAASASRPIPHSEKLAMDSPSVPKPRAAPPATSAPLYAIAIGAFAVKNNATALSARLSAYDARVTPFARNGQEMWRVELGSPGGREDARSALAFARALGFPHAWVVDRGRLSRSAEKSASNTIVNRGTRTRNRVPRMRPSLNT